MNITFRDAVMISVALHSAIFLPVYSKNISSYPAKQKDSITVDYVRLKEPERVIKSEPPRIEAIPRVEMKQAVNPPATRAPVVSAKESAAALAARQARIKSTTDYINYYDLIRDRIRQKLKDRYRTYYGEGDTILAFVLRADGKLLSVSVDPAAPECDRMLVSAAIQSVKEASPFTPFPKALSLPQMSFTLAVSFKKQ